MAHLRIRCKPVVEPQDRFLADDLFTLLVTEAERTNLSTVRFMGKVSFKRYPVPADDMDMSRLKSLAYAQLRGLGFLSLTWGTMNKILHTITRAVDYCCNPARECCIVETCAQVGTAEAVPSPPTTKGGAR